MYVCFGVAHLTIKTASAASFPFIQNDGIRENCVCLQSLERLRAGNADEAAFFFCLRAHLDASLIKAAPLRCPVAPTSTTLWGLKLISILARIAQERERKGPNGAGWERNPCGWHLGWLLFDAGHVSAAAPLIHHSNCEWRTGTAEEPKKATPNPPSSHYILSNQRLCCSLNGEWGPCVPRFQMGKNNTAHTPLRLSSGTERNGVGNIIGPLRVFVVMCGRKKKNAFQMFKD